MATESPKMLVYYIPVSTFFTVLQLKLLYSNTLLNRKRQCPLQRGVGLWEVKNVRFLCGWDYELRSVCLCEVNIYRRYPLAEAWVNTVLKYDYKIIPLINLVCSVITGKSQTEALMY